jgi:hypothetical protein
MHISDTSYFITSYIRFKYRLIIQGAITRAVHMVSFDQQPDPNVHMGSFAQWLLSTNNLIPASTYGR